MSKVSHIFLNEYILQQNKNRIIHFYSNLLTKSFVLVHNTVVCLNLNSYNER